MLTEVLGCRDAPSGCSQPFLYPPNLREKHQFLVKLNIFSLFFLCLFVFGCCFFFLQTECPGGVCVFFLWCHHLQIPVSPSHVCPKGSGCGPKQKALDRAGTARAAASQDTHEMALEPQPWCWGKKSLQGFGPQKFPMLQYLTQGWGFFPFPGKPSEVWSSS